MSMNWYVVHAYSGFENQVKRSLEDRISRNGMDKKFGDILVPTEEVVEMKEGLKRKSERKFFPGYVLVEMEMIVQNRTVICHNVTSNLINEIAMLGEQVFPINCSHSDHVWMACIRHNTLPIRPNLNG